VFNVLTSTILGWVVWFCWWASAP